MANKTSAYTIKAVKNYQSKYDGLSLRLEKGTKERIKNAYQGALNNFVCDLVYKELERLESEQKISE